MLHQSVALWEEVLYVIFVELQKAYDALDRSRCLDILESYGVGPRACQILHTYWRQLTMVARVCGYYGAVFKVDCGVTQGDRLSPTIFNVVVDAFVRLWVTVMSEGAEAQGKHGQEGRHQNALFYADDDMVAFPNPRWIQGAFSTLVDMFYGRNIVSMVCCPCQASGTQSEVAYR